MGILLKIGLFIFVGAWIFKGIKRLLDAAQKRGPQQTHQQPRPKDGNVDVNYAPKKAGNEKSTQNYKGGDYVDFEEVE